MWVDAVLYLRIIVRHENVRRARGVVTISARLGLVLRSASCTCSVMEQKTHTRFWFNVCTASSDEAGFNLFRTVKCFVRRIVTAAFRS